MKAIRRTLELLRVNWKILVIFELSFKAAVAVGFTLLMLATARKAEIILNFQTALLFETRFQG